MMKNLMRVLAVLPVALLMITLAIPFESNAQQLTTTTIEPDGPEVATRPATQLSREEIERLANLKERIRERMAEMAPIIEGGPGAPAFPGRETVAVDVEAQYPGPASTFKIGRNNKNTNANGSLGSTLAEPAAANEGARVLAAGNFNHAEYSTNGGTTWTNIALPAGPADAPSLCCDNEVVYDQSRGIWVLMSLYINSSLSNGVVRLFIFRTLPTYSCSYTIDQAGTSDNVLMDFPHIRLSNKFLYLASNDIGGSPSQSARMRRYDLDAMADCVTASGASYAWPNTTEGQKVWRPISGATDIMYWAHHATTSSLRVFTWPESSTTITNALKTVTATTFANPICKGGLNNADWTDSLWSNIVGFNLNGAMGRDYIAWYWNAGADTAHTQGHSHGAIFAKSGITLVASPAIYNTTRCMGQVTVAMNERGDIGAQVSFGANNPGGTTIPAVQGYVGMDDEYTTGLGQFGTIYLVASGNYIRTDGRHGDYFTVHQHEPCDMWFNATSYALSGGTGIANMNSRYVEFGRGRDEKCWLRWKDILATP